MKALTIKQPWVHAIFMEGKDIENRTWPSRHRGWIAIHASKTPRQGAKFPRGHQVPNLKELEYSAICGVARVADMVTKSRSKWFQKPGRNIINYGWTLKDVTPLNRPIPCKGMLGLWTVSPGTVRAIKRQLPELDFSDDE